MQLLICNLFHLQIMNGTAILGVPIKTPDPGEDYSVIHGLRVAIETLNECSEIQHEKRTSLNENTSKLVNRGRVICITSARDNSNMKSLENIFLNELAQENKTALASDQSVLSSEHSIKLSRNNILNIHIFVHTDLQPDTH